MLRRLFPVRLTQWLGPLFTAGGVVFLCAVVIIVSGVFDLSAAKPHPEGWARFLHYTFDRSTAYHADAKPPADLDSPIRVAAGAAYYGQVCARCHSGPGLGQNPVVLSMHPKPQYLAADLPLSGFTAPELFRILKAGVKYSAMPSWPATGRDDEIWQLVAFLRALPKMSPATFQQLALAAPQPGDAAMPFGGVPRQARYALRNDAEPPVWANSYKTPVYGFSGFALAGDPVATCARCHGRDGAGGGAFPNLTVLNRNYIAQTLTAFAAGRRRSGYMQVMATELSPQQIAALADHYAALPRRATEPAGAPAPAVGRQLALVGIPSRGLAPCASCHGEQGASRQEFPLLAGQARWYLANQMRVFRAGGRGTIAGPKAPDPMVAIARKLTERESEAVSAWYAAQPPAAVQGQAAFSGAAR